MKNEVTMNVTPFVRKILIIRYGGEPIIVERADALHTYLQAAPLPGSKEEKYQEAGKRLTEEVKLLVSWNLKRHLRVMRRRVMVGYHLHKVYQMEMVNFMEAQRKAGMSATDALRTFMDDHQIEEEDFSMESAYTVWKRKKDFFQEKDTTFRRETDPQKHIKNIQHVVNSERGVPYDCREVSNSLCTYYNTTMETLCRYDHSRQASAQRKVLCYLLKRDAKMSYRDIALIIESNLGNVCRMVNEVRHHLDHYQDIHRDIAQIRLAYVRPSAITPQLIRLAL
jgi:hypothetical protein